MEKQTQNYQYSDTLSKETNAGNAGGGGSSSSTATKDIIDSSSKSDSNCIPPRQNYHPFTFAELFAGIGGFRMGLEPLGGKCVFASEIDPLTQAVYRKRWNIDSDVLAGDITKVKSNDIPDHDLLVGGFPCQPFSRLGGQGAFEDSRGVLYKEILRILKDKKPKMFLLENVPGILDRVKIPKKVKAKVRMGPYAMKPSVEASNQEEEDYCPLDIIIEDLKMGKQYDVSYKIYNSDTITPQARRRVYLVGIRRDLDSKRRKIRFPSTIQPNLNILPKDIISFSEPTPRELRLSPSQLETLWPKLNGNVIAKMSKSKILLYKDTDEQLAPIVSHYGVSPGHGNFQLVARESGSSENGVPRVLSFDEGLRGMGMDPHPFGDLNEWMKEALADKNPSVYKRAGYKMIGNAVCPPVICWLAAEVVLPAGGFLIKGSEHDELPEYLELALMPLI